MFEQGTKLFSTFYTDLDFVLVAVVIGKVERSEAFVTLKAFEKLYGSFNLNIVTTKTQMDKSLVVSLNDSSQLLEACIGKAILA